MVGQLRAKPGADAVPASIGAMTSTRVAGRFQVVYLVANTIMNVTTQDEQLTVFVNAPGHLSPGGCFVVEVIAPQLCSVPGYVWPPLRVAVRAGSDGKARRYAPAESPGRLGARGDQF
jgi:hypothetical protein